MRFEYLGQVYLDEKTGKKKIKLLNPDQFPLDLQKYDENDRVVLKLETFYRSRSKDQNGALHWYFDKLSEHTGYTKDEMKAMLKVKFLMEPMLDQNGNQVIDVDSGEVQMVVRDTRALSTVEFSEFMKQVREWGWNVLRVELPEPDKNWKLNLR